MKIRFQADADLDPDIGRGLCRLERAIDFSPSQLVIPAAASDPDVLRIAADANRVLVSGDVRTMPGHFAAFTTGRESPGLIMIPPRTPTGKAIEGLFLAWLAWTAEEMRNQLRWLP